MEQKGSPPRPARPPRGPPAKPVKPRPRPILSGNPNEPEGVPASSKNLGNSMAVGGTVSEGLLLRRPTTHGMTGRTSFEAHTPGMSHSYKQSVEPQFAQATFAQGSYFPGANHRLI
jgi:hypothetical protein